MKKIATFITPPGLRGLVIGLAALALASLTATAAPFASTVTTNGAGQVYFYLNEAGATVTVTFDNATVLNMGVVNFVGQTNFTLPAGVNGYSISCSKQGSGTGTQFTSNSSWYNTYSSGQRGIAINKNPKIGKYFGNICAAHQTTGYAQAPLGVYLLNPDGSKIAGPAGNWASSSGNGPWRVRSNPDGTWLVNDFNAATAALYLFSADLSTSNSVFSPIGTAAATAGICGNNFGTAFMQGSLAAGNLVLYTFDPNMPVPADTNCLKGPLTSVGSYNCVFAYNIGAGPLPWSKRPDYAYTMGLDGIANLRTEGDVGPDGKVYCGFGRANASNPNLQILGPIFTTNGITGDYNNYIAFNAAKDATNWLYCSGVTPPENFAPPGGTAGDLWDGVNGGSGSIGGTYAGVRLSPDGKWFASVDVYDGITVASVTNGIPNDGTIFNVPNSSYTANSRGMDWDAADNLYVHSSGCGCLQRFFSRHYHHLRLQQRLDRHQWHFRDRRAWSLSLGRRHQPERVSELHQQRHQPRRSHPRHVPH